MAKKIPVSVYGVRECSKAKQAFATPSRTVEIADKRLAADMRCYIIGKTIERVMVQGSYIGLELADGSTLEVYVDVQPVGEDVRLAFDINAANPPLLGSEDQ